MAAKRRAKPAAPKFRQTIEGEVTHDEEQGVVVWDFIPDEQTEIPAHGYAAGGVIADKLVGKRVRITIEEL